MTTTDNTLGGPAASWARPPTLRLTYWVPTQYSVDLDPIKLSVRLRAAGFHDEAATVIAIAAGNFPAGHAADHTEIGADPTPLSALAHAIRVTDSCSTVSRIGASVTVEDPETYHVYVGEGR